MVKRTIGLCLLMMLISSFANASSEQSAQPAPANEQDQQVEEAFKRSLRALIPMNSDQVEQTKQKALKNEKASRLAAPTILSAPSRSLSLQPGAQVQSIQIYPNYPTSLKFLDCTGAPWPVVEAKGGNDNWLKVERSESEPGNLVTLSNGVNEANCGVLVVLQPNIPVSFGVQISATGGRAETSISFRVDRSGPLALPPVMAKPHTSSATPQLLSFLDGVAPSGSIRLETDVREVEVWRLDGYYYLRSPWEAQWPDYDGKAESGEGETATYVYRIPPVPSLIVNKDSGVAVTVNVKEEK